MACGVGCSSSPEVTLPPGPAACAGDLGTPTAAQARDDQWTYARQESPGDLWVGFARVLTAEELVEATAGLDVVGALVVYPFHQGTYLKAMMAVPPGEDAAGLRRSVTAEMVGTLDQGGPEDDDVRRSRERFAAGDLPFGGARLSGEAHDVARFVDGNRCLVHSLLPGEGGQQPLLPDEVDPS